MDEAALWKAKEGGCTAARTALVEKYLYLVGITRRRRFRTVGEDYAEDLEAEGRLMLVRCVDEFDPSRGSQFKSYAITKIWGAMAERCRRDDWVPRAERERQRAGEAAVIQPVESLDDQSEEPVVEFDTERLLAAMQAGALSRLIRYLPHRERVVLQRHILEERAMASLVEETGRCPTTIHRYRDSGLHRLRCFLGKTGAIDAT